LTFAIPAPLVLHRWEIVCNSFDPARLGTAWLPSYASYIRTALASEPALLEKFNSGAADHDGEMEYIADALEALHFQGLEPDEAAAVWAAVTAMAMVASAKDTANECMPSRAGPGWRGSSQ
jgi:hypothetical protein